MYDAIRLGGLHAECSAHTESSRKGAALEDLVQHVFEGIPSVTLYERDVKDEDGAQEIDLAFMHLHHMSAIPIVDISIMVECKNEETRTSSSQVGAFGKKLRTRSLSTGILVTTAGLAGGRGKHAHRAVSDELTLGSAIIVVRTEELASCRSPVDVTHLLSQRLMELRTFRGYRVI